MGQPLNLLYTLAPTHLHLEIEACWGKCLAQGHNIKAMSVILRGEKLDISLKILHHLRHVPRGRAYSDSGCWRNHPLDLWPLYYEKFVS